MVDLQRLRPLVEVMAAERTQSAPEHFEDAVQEGLIAAWTASERHPGKEARYYAAAARRGVGGVVRGRPPTGHVPKRGWQDAHGTARPLDDEDDCADISAFEEWAHIRAVVGSLPIEDQAIVHGRYWLDMTYAELAKAMHRGHDRIGERWNNHIRPLLAERLAA